jgi:cytochrome c nitrite reductase small subunit
MKLPIIVGVVALIAVLIAGAYVTEFTTYLGSNPTTCNNCHVMDAAYEGWYHGAAPARSYLQ